MARGKDFKSKAEFVLEGKDKLKGPFRSAKQSVGSFVSNLGPAKIALGALTAAGVAATAAVIGMAKGIIDTSNEVATLGDRYDKLNARLGISVEDLSRFDYIANRSGITTQNMTLAVQRMTRRLAEAKTGTGVAVKVLEDLNIPIERFEGLKPAEQFREVMAAIDDVEDPTKRLATAFKFFDSEGTAVLQTIQGGIEGFDEMGERAAELGAIMSTDLSKASATYKDSLTDLDATVQGVKNTLAAQFLPVMTDVVEKVTGFAAELASDEGFAQTLKRLGELAGQTTTFLIDATDKAIKVSEFLLAVVAGSSREAAPVQLEENRILGLGGGAPSDVSNVRGLPPELMTGDVPGLPALGSQPAASPFAGMGADLFGMGTSPGPMLPPAEYWADALAQAQAQLSAIGGAGYTPGPLGDMPPSFAEEQAAMRGGTFGEMPAGLEEGLGSALAFPEPEQMDQMLEVLEVAGGLAVETEGGIIVLPKPGELKKTEKDIVSAKKAIDDFGASTERAFIDDFSAGVKNMMSGITDIAVTSIRTGKNFADAAADMWQGFMSGIMSMLIKLILKLTAAAILQSYIGMGNPRAASNVKSLLGGFGMAEGGLVGDVARVGGRGDIVGPVMLDPREFVLNPAATQALGVDYLNRVNRGGVPGGAAVSSPSSSDLLKSANLDLTVHTIYGTQAEGRAVAEEIHAYMVDGGLVAA